MIGLGYIGLPTATMFAARRKTVIGVDIDQRVVDTVNQGRIHIVEPELDMLVQAAVGTGCLRATTVAEPADAFLIAVPTPLTSDHRPDLSAVRAAAQAIAPVLTMGNLVILESTSPVGTTEQLAAQLAAARPDLSFPQHAGEQADVQIAYCPERVLPGRVVHELVNNDRVIGGMTQTAGRWAAALYRTFVHGELVLTDPRTAELCKLTENSFRDVNIAFANELSLVCERFGVNVWQLIALANRHPRVNILQPGAGVGGHCIAVDPWFIVDGAPADARLIRAAREINDDKPQRVIERIKAALADALAAQPQRRLAELKVACLGLAFKADIDDLRESPALVIAAGLAGLGCEVLAVEPHISTLPVVLQQPHVRLTALDEALTADVVCVLVKHRVFSASVALLRRHGACIDVVGVLN